MSMSPDQRPASRSIDRRDFLVGAGAAGIGFGAAMGALTQTASAPDYSLRIAPMRLELAPGKVIETFAYNGMVPGPVLRLREGRQVSIDIRNDTDVDDIIHWHGLYVPSEADGAMEEGSPMVERGGTQRYTFAAKPTGTRWYHSHDMAGTDLSAKPIFRNVRVPDRRAGERSRPLRSGSAACSAPLGGLLGQHAGYPHRSATRQRSGGDVRVGVLQRQDARPRGARPRARRPERPVSAAQCQPDREHHAGPFGSSLFRDRARRKSGAFATRRSTRSFSHPRNVPM